MKPSSVWLAAFSRLTLCFLELTPTPQTGLGQRSSIKRDLLPNFKTGLRQKTLGTALLPGQLPYRFLLLLPRPRAQAAQLIGTRWCRPLVT